MTSSSHAAPICWIRMPKAPRPRSHAREDHAVGAGYAPLKLVGDERHAIARPDDIVHLVDGHRASLDQRHQQRIGRQHQECWRADSPTGAPE